MNGEVNRRNERACKEAKERALSGDLRMPYIQSGDVTFGYNGYDFEERGEAFVMTGPHPKSERHEISWNQIRKQTEEIMEKKNEAEQNGDFLSLVGDCVYSSNRFNGRAEADRAMRLIDFMLDNGKINLMNAVSGDTGKPLLLAITGKVCDYVHTHKNENTDNFAARLLGDLFDRAHNIPGHEAKRWRGTGYDDIDIDWAKDMFRCLNMIKDRNGVEIAERMMACGIGSELYRDRNGTLIDERIPNDNKGIAFLKELCQKRRDRGLEPPTAVKGILSNGSDEGKVQPRSKGPKTL